MEGLIYPRGAYISKGGLYCNRTRKRTLKQAKQWQCLSKYVLHFNTGF